MSFWGSETSSFPNNILAFQSRPLEKGKSAVRLVVDNPAVAKSILDRQKTDYAETEVESDTRSPWKVVAVNKEQIVTAPNAILVYRIYLSSQC